MIVLRKRDENEAEQTSEGGENKAGVDVCLMVDVCLVIVGELDGLFC